MPLTLWSGAGPGHVSERPEGGMQWFLLAPLLTAEPGIFKTSEHLSKPFLHQPLATSDGASQTGRQQPHGSFCSSKIKMFSVTFHAFEDWVFFCFG